MKLLVSSIFFLLHCCDGFLRVSRGPNLRTFRITTQEVSYLGMVSSYATDDVASPRLLVSQGMEAFRQGNVQRSIELFDRAESKVPDGSLTPFLWQRGISYYYVDRFEDASKQVIYQLSRLF